MRRFAEEFGSRIREMQENCFFLLCGERPVGTATAWYNEDFLGQSCGRLHWVAIHPDFQGRGLAKPMISLALKSLRKRYTRCYLTTDTHRLRAIRIYLDFGFEPHTATDLQREAWSRVAVELGHPGFGT